jgi:hypothetical protein
MEFSSLPEFESLITNLLSTGKCACHIINPTKTRILLWKDKDNKTTYHLRIGIQKFVSQEQLDRNGEIYWRFMVKEGETLKSESPTLDPVTKFQQRQAQTKSYGNNTNASKE